MEIVQAENPEVAVDDAILGRQAHARGAAGVVDAAAPDEVILGGACGPADEGAQPRDGRGGPHGGEYIRGERATMRWANVEDMPE